MIREEIVEGEGFGEECGVQPEKSGEGGLGCILLIVRSLRITAQILDISVTNLSQNGARCCLNTRADN